MAQYTMLKECNKKTMGAYLAPKNYGVEFYWPRFFPFKYTPFLSYETLVGSKGRNVAADIVSYNTSAPLKARQVVGKLSGDIPAIRVKREMTEADINMYNILKAQSTAQQKELFKLIFGDSDFVMKACFARLEWMALQALSQGTITLNSTNNAGVITETAISFQMQAANLRIIKSATSTRAWQTGTAAQILPITDIRVLQAAAKANGDKIKFLLMDVSKFEQMAVADEVKQLALPYSGYGLIADSTKAPMVTVAAINAALLAQGLPQIVIIDQLINLETKVHVITATNPWTTKYVTGVPSLVLGDMYYGPIAEETNPPKQIIQVKKNNVLISKWRTVDPVCEWTKGEINAFVSWPAVDQCYRLDTEQYGAGGLD